MTFFFIFILQKLLRVNVKRELEKGQYLKRIKSDTREWVEYTKVTRECD